MQKTLYGKPYIKQKLMRDRMKIPEKAYSSNVLRGKDLEDQITAKIEDVGTVVFNQGQEDEREAYSITVSSEELQSQKQFSPNQGSLRVLVEGFGDETDGWIGKTIRLTPVPSKTPEGTPTTSIAVTIPKAKK